MNPKLEVKGNEVESAAAELGLVIQLMAERQNDEREKLTKRYTATEEEARAYDHGFTNGYEAGRQKGFGEGFDEGLKQAKKEEEESK